MNAAGEDTKGQYKTVTFIPGTLTDIAGLVIAVALLLINVKKWEKGPKFIMDKHKAKQEQK